MRPLIQNMYQLHEHVPTHSTVAEGENVPISCFVEGGVPNTSNVTVVCAGRLVENNVFVFTRDMNFAHCVCKAAHLSGCYLLQTDVLVNVACKY